MDFNQCTKDEIALERENGIAICKHMDDDGIIMDRLREAFDNIDIVEGILAQKINNPYSLRLAEDAQEAKTIIYHLQSKLKLIKDLYGEIGE